jgi:hypothetical protein
MRGEATGDSCVEDMRELRLDGGGYSELKEGASERAAEKSSYGMSERAPEVDMVNEDPDMRRLLMPPSKPSVSPSPCCPEYLRSRMGIASSVV